MAQRLRDEVVQKGSPMFEGLLQPMHLILILAVALIVFGPRRLPEIGKGLGEAIRGFKKALDDGLSNPSTPTGQAEIEHRPKITDQSPPSA
jgi:sec-independent protein translocase protein TatA